MIAKVKSLMYVWSKRCYETKSQTLKLKDEGGLQESLPLTPYIDVVESIPSLEDVEHGRRELSSKIEEVFFEEFLANYSVLY